MRGLAQRSPRISRNIETPMAIVPVTIIRFSDKGPEEGGRLNARIPKATIRRRNRIAPHPHRKNIVAAQASIKDKSIVGHQSLLVPVLPKQPQGDRSQYCQKGPSRDHKGGITVELHLPSLRFVAQNVYEMLAEQPTP